MSYLLGQAYYHEIDTPVEGYSDVVNDNPFASLVPEDKNYPKSNYEDLFNNNDLLNSLSSSEVVEKKQSKISPTLARFIKDPLSLPKRDNIQLRLKMGMSYLLLPPGSPFEMLDDRIEDGYLDEDNFFDLSDPSASDSGTFSDSGASGRTTPKVTLTETEQPAPETTVFEQHLTPNYDQILAEVPNEKREFKKSVGCLHCKQDFSSTDDYIRHLGKFSLIPSHFCVDTDCLHNRLAFMKVVDLRIHYARDHLSRYNALKLVSKIRHLRRHPFLRKMLDAMYVCHHEGCKRAFYRKDTLSRHHRLVHTGKSSFKKEKVSPFK